jgi:membrane protease YdiL (CAAX protease family)
VVEQKLEQTPWSLRQTLIGASLTLVPWILLALGLASLNTSGKPAHPHHLSPQADLLSAIVTFLFSVLVEGAFLIAPLYFANRAVPAFGNHRLAVLNALGFRRFQWVGALSLIVVLFLAFYLVNGSYQYVITVFHLNLQTNDQVILQQSKEAPLTTYATLIASVVVAPICEETFFRSFVFAGFLNRMPVAVAVLLSSFLFAIAHADLGSFAVLFFIGLALAFVRWRTHSIWPGILLHLLNNGIGALVIVLIMTGVLKQ